MNALTAEDLHLAASCIRQRAYEARRMIEAMGELCPPDYAETLRAREADHLRRAWRFELAANAADTAWFQQNPEQPVSTQERAP